jgi:NDP-sugar pyrophosphorylase family protein
MRSQPRERFVILSLKKMFTPAEFLDLEHTAHPKLFEGQQYVWDALKQIASYLQFRLKPAVLGDLMGKPFISNNVFIGKGTIVEQGAVLKGPAWIGENCHIRSSCYVRENVVAGDGVVMGNSCEFKNCILFDDVQVPHFNYIGDSILGYHAHLGAGVILSNVKLDHGEIAVATSEGEIATGLTKFGAIIGDRTEIGCNAVINPGSILGRDCMIYPGVNFRGVLSSRSIIKLRQDVQVLKRRDQGAI